MGHNLSLVSHANTKRILWHPDNYAPPSGTSFPPPVASLWGDFHPHFANLQKNLSHFSSVSRNMGKGSKNILTLSHLQNPQAWYAIRAEVEFLREFSRDRKQGVRWLDQLKMGR